MNVCRNRRFFTAAAAAVLGVLVLAEPQAAKQGFASGTALCLDRVLPALFPFFVVCELLMAAPPPAVLLRPLQRVLGLESAEAAQAVVLSWVGGYAVCARLAGQLYDAGRISRRDAVRLQILGCCSGPGFVIGCVGGLLLGNVRLGVVLYAAQIGANLAAGVVCLFGVCGRTRGDAPDLRDGCGGAMRVTAPRADASVRPYSATGQHFNRHHLRCHILAVGLRVRGVFPAGRCGTGGSDSAAVGVGQRGVGGQRRVCGLCGAGRAGGAVRLLRSAQPAGGVGLGADAALRRGSVLSADAARQPPAASCVFAGHFTVLRAVFAGGCGGVQHAFCPDRTTFASAARRCGGGVCLSLRSPLQGLAKPL